MMTINEKDIKRYNIPEYCPFCSEKLEITDARVRCVNEFCVTHAEHRISKWIDTIGALGFGEAMIKYLVYDCHIDSIANLYCNDIVVKAIEGTNLKKNVQKAFADLWARSKNINLWDFVAGFDIDGIGSKVVKLIVDKGFNTFDALCKVNYDELMSIDGFGDVRADIFLNSIMLLKDDMRAVLDTNRVTIKEETSQTVSEKTSGLTFVITGSLTNPRKFYEEKITSTGNKLGSSVNKKTDYLVTSDPNSGSSKNKKAAELGIKVIGEDEFMRILNG